jgi:antitoxin VapB
MGMNIKDPQVHAMARQLAQRRGTTVTDAVRQALAAELERTPDLGSDQALEARKAEIRAICERFRQRLPLDGPSSEELQAALYDEGGLPR